MLTVNIICIGSLKEKYLRDAQSEYVKRLGAFCKLNIIELDEVKLPDNPSQNEINSALEKEADKIEQKIKNGSFVIPLVIEGKTISSEQLAKRFSDVSVQGVSTVSFIIGSSFGLSGRIKSRANFSLSMSPMTFPHQLARIMLLEQTYRAFSIINNSKYHK